MGAGGDSMPKAEPNEFKKLTSQLLKAKSGAVQEIHIPKMKYLMVDGTGAPASRSYQQAIQGLYSHAYTIKFLPKSGVPVKGYEQFSVAPLQGLYGKFEEGWNWTLLIAVPNFVTNQTVMLARDEMRRKKKEINDAVRLEEWEEGDAIQTLHLGPYDKEQPAINMLHDYAAAHNYALAGRQDEIYMNDPRRVAPEKIKVIIRYPVKKS
jgi:hypothetical protein